MAIDRHTRRMRSLIIGLIVVVLIGAAAGPQLLAFVTAPKLSGYLQAAPDRPATSLDWEALHQATWANPGVSAPHIPASVVALDGKPVTLKGYLLPLHETGDSSQFFIAAKPRGCYFCNPPGVAEVTEIDIADGRAIAFTDFPVTVYGTLHVATGAKDAMLYRISDASLQAHGVMSWGK